MNKYYLSGLLCAVAILLCACATTPKEPCPTAPLVKSGDTRKTTGKWLLFSKKNFTRKPGQMMAMSIAGGKELPGFNALVFDKKPILPMSASSDWVVQPEYVHHILQSPVVITPYQCPTRPDCPACPTNPTDPTEPTNPSPIEADKSWGRARVHAKEAMAKVDTSNVKVCVVDTGIDLQHQNKGNVIGSQSFAGAVQDGAGHGTHTAGTIAGTGGVGVSRAKLLICKGLSDSGSGSSSGLAQCLTWCGQQGAQIVSNSWGSSQSDPMINQAIAGLTQKGIAVVVSNGNDGRGVLNWPAQLSINNPLVFGSAASDERDQKATFSTYGPGTKAISPGVNIISNRPGGGTQAMSGTSMSAPHLAGMLAYCVPLQRPFQSCLKSTGTVAGYPFFDALATAQ